MLETYRKLFDILPDSDKWKFVVLLFLMTAGMVMEVIGIGMIPVFISAVSDPGLILDHEWLGPVSSYVGINNGEDLLWYGGIGMVVVFLVKTVYLVWFNYLKAKFVYNRFSIISRRLFETYMSAPYTFHLNRNTAELIRNVTNETRYISNNVLMPSMNILMESVTVAGICLLLLFSEPFITFISFGVIGGGGWVMLHLLKSKLRAHGQTASRERSRMIQGVNEGIGGFKDVTIMNRQQLFFDRFKGYVNNLTTAEIFKDVARKAAKPTIEFVSVAGMIAISFTLIWQGRAMSTIVPILTLFGAAVVRLMPAVNRIVSDLTKLKYYIYALNPVHADIKEMESHYDSAKANKAIVEKLSFEKSIDLQNVSFSYPNSEEAVLKDISMSIKKSSAIGFVGPTGAGKSTIVDVILGLLEPEEGKVLVDGKDISKHKRKWQNNVGYIPQFIYLADDTIRNNIAFGIPEDQISDRKIQDAVNAAHLSSLINDLSNGLDTMVGEDGVRLSGGQRQRVGIARALYDNPEVLIMDEGTSSLDNITEGQVISAIEDLKGERTIIMIAHRLTTVENCDTIFMMEEGSLIDYGSYDELQRSNEVFRKMSKMNS